MWIKVINNIVCPICNMIYKVKHVDWKAQLVAVYFGTFAQKFPYIIARRPTEHRDETL